MNEKTKITGLLITLFIFTILFWGCMIYVVYSRDMFVAGALSVYFANEAYQKQNEGRNTATELGISRFLFLWTLYLGVQTAFA
jgi:hypothetical protein